MTDAELVGRCRAGDADAWNELVVRFSRYVYAVCLRGFRLNQTDAEDAYQEVFTRVYTRLDTLRDDDALRPWIAQLTRRVCLDALARNGREHPSSEPFREEATEIFAEIEEAVSLHEAMSTLPQACQEVLDRFFARDESYQTISAALDLPQGTIASRIARCLRKLREELEGRNEPPAGSRKL
jgi:RNA polymerase sigma factor (sigma-70 family)